MKSVPRGDRRIASSILSREQRSQMCDLMNNDPRRDIGRGIDQYGGGVGR
jgi:hypothetical protein